MASFNVVNYSLRPSKSIQRSLVFDGVRQVQGRLGLHNILYVGFGSVWFTDFHLAHRVLHVPEMISIEADDVGFQRANFNKPFKTVTVKKGYSFDVLPDLHRDAELSQRPWMLWLDYDYELSETGVQDIRLAIEQLPKNSILLATFNCLPHKYGKPRDRHERIRALLGSVVPDDRDVVDYDETRLSGVLSDYLLDFMKATAAASARRGGFSSAFRMAYRDGAPMVTVGGFLPGEEEVGVVQEIVSSPTWLGLIGDAIEAPHLTMKEVTALQSELPTSETFDRELIRRLGFDLEPDQIEAFRRYYRFYPSFSQVVA